MKIIQSMMTRVKHVFERCRKGSSIILDDAGEQTCDLQTHCTTEAGVI